MYEKRQVLYLSVLPIKSVFLPAYFASAYVHRKRRYTKGTAENSDSSPLNSGIRWNKCAQKCTIECIYQPETLCNTFYFNFWKLIISLRTDYKK